QVCKDLLHRLDDAKGDDVKVTQALLYAQSRRARRRGRRDRERTRRGGRSGSGRDAAGGLTNADPS
ncbi:hypothetical protein ABT369_12605, partial [Dactylosporangium sp. NPDC000244]|uniref:hypothetical protein n=1 Tax=Dactylosporangium sp. NPDC000244 TaxID=3154365 RepID=UPI003330FE37